MQPIVLLHGAIGASSQFKQLAEYLGTTFKVYTPDFSGHGGKPLTGKPFSMRFFADEVLRFMQQENLEKPSVFGYSMGGYVAMYLARYFPDRIDKVITLATKYHWNEAAAAKEVQMLNPQKIEEKLPIFAEALLKMHQPNDWKELLVKTAEMLTALGKDNTLKPTDYSSTAVPALILLGDRDKMVSLEETLAVFKALPKAQMGMLPNTPHPIEQVNPELLGSLIKRFLE